jgi:hypothetical protein
VSRDRSRSRLFDKEKSEREASHDLGRLSVRINGHLEPSDSYIRM